jgi:hypothetical protein
MNDLQDLLTLGSEANHARANGDGEGWACSCAIWGRGGRFIRLIARATGISLLLRLWSKRGRRGLRSGDMRRQAGACTAGSLDV